MCARVFRQQGDDIQLLVLFPVPFLIGSSALIEYIQKIFAKCPDLLGISYTFTRGEQVLPQSVSVDFQRKAGPCRMIGLLDAEQLIFKIDDALPDADEETVTPPDLF